MNPSCNASTVDSFSSPSGTVKSTVLNLGNVPRRSQLLKQIEAANRWGVMLAVVQFLAVVLLAILIDWNQAVTEPWVTTVAIGAVVGPFAMELLRFWVVKKKRIEDLKEQTRFGEFDKYRLAKLYKATLDRLRLPNDRLPVYIVADKSMNAAMMHVGMGRIFRALNGIYLNRQVLHKLTADEIQDIMGHELGHYYRHYLLSDRYRLLTLVLGSMLGMFVAQLLGMEGFFSMIALLVCSQGFWWLAAWQRARHSMAIEFLCDDFGAQVSGIATSVAGLMKLGAEMEVLTAIQQQAILSASSGKLDAHEVVEAIFTAIPYGHATPEEIQKAVAKQIEKRSEQGATVGGFLRYMWQSDVDAEAGAELEKAMRKLKALESVPRLPWESLLRNPKEIQFDEQSISALVAMIESHPEAELFHTPEALGESDGQHPPLKLRVLYLWHNRHEIEAVAAGAAA